MWKYHYTPGMHEPVTMGEILINSEVWDKLSPVHKEIIKSATAEAMFRWYAKWQKQNAEALHEFRDKHKVNVLKTPDEVLYDFLKAWDKIAAREAEKDPFFKKVLESQRQYASLVVPAKRFLFPPYAFAANYYWPEKRDGRRAGGAGAGAGEEIASPHGRERAVDRPLSPGNQEGLPHMAEPPLRCSRQSGSSTASAGGRARRSPGSSSRCS